MVYHIFDANYRQQERLRLCLTSQNCCLVTQNFCNVHTFYLKNILYSLSALSCLLPPSYTRCMDAPWNGKAVTLTTLSSLAALHFRHSHLHLLCVCVWVFASPIWLLAAQGAGRTQAHKQMGKQVASDCDFRWSPRPPKVRLVATK